MGEVYRARDTRLSRDVAVKVIRHDARDIPDRLPRFEREARAIAALNHPNILALHDIGSDGDIVYAVTELLEGETLRTRLAVGSIPPPKTIEYATQVARGLAAAHERGIVHRDVKPENLFITRDGRVKILDFGLAQHESPSPAAGTATQFTTVPGVVLGTPGYMSPEQLRGQPATAKSDLFALGVVVHEMLAGANPFRRPTAAETAAATLREDPPSLLATVPGVPAGIAKIVERCLDKEAGERPSSAGDLALFFDAVGTQSAETQARGRAEALAPARRLRNRLLAISCGLLILLSAVTWGVVRIMTDRTVAAAIDAELERGARLAEGVQSNRFADLALTARLVASFPDLRALFATDAATVRDFLLSYQQRIPRIPMLIAVGPNGTLIAGTDEVTAEGDDQWIRTLLDARDQPAVVNIRDRLYHAAVAPAEAGGNMFGYVAAVAPVDEIFATALRDATGDDVLLLTSGRAVASTLRTGQLPWVSLEDWRGAAGESGRIAEALVGVQRFAAREVTLSAQPPLVAIVLASRDEATAPFRQIQNAVVIAGLLAALVAIASSAWLARTLAKLA
jgi:hypothetical protein